MTRLRQMWYLESMDNLVKIAVRPADRQRLKMLAVRTNKTMIDAFWEAVEILEGLYNAKDKQAEDEDGKSSIR